MIFFYHLLIYLHNQILFFLLLIYYNINNIYHLCLILYQALNYILLNLSPDSNNLMDNLYILFLILKNLRMCRKTDFHKCKMCSKIVTLKNFPNLVILSASGSKFPFTSFLFDILLNL